MIDQKPLSYSEHKHLKGNHEQIDQSRIVAVLNNNEFPNLGS